MVRPRRRHLRRLLRGPGGSLGMKGRVRRRGIRVGDDRRLRKRQPAVPPCRPSYRSAYVEYDPWVDEQSAHSPRFERAAAKPMPKRDPIADHHNSRNRIPTPVDGRRATPTNPGRAGGTASLATGQGSGASSSSSAPWTWTPSHVKFRGVIPDQIMWIRNTYSELEVYLLEKYTNTLGARDARSYVDTMLQRMHSMCTGEVQFATGNDLQSRWKRWICHAVLAMSNLSDPSMSTTVDWLTGNDTKLDTRTVLAMLQQLEKKNRATKIYRFTSMQLSVLCLCPSEDSAAPPDPDAAIMVHLFGDATALLRSNQRAYTFTETLQGLGHHFQGERVDFEDHCIAGCQLISIAENIMETAKI